jgi:hypothetical protein
VLLRDLHDRGLFQGRRGVRAQGLRAVRILDGRAAPRSRLHRPDRDATAHGHSRPQPSVAEPYVCIAVQNTLQAKCWNNPTGWREIVSFLKQSGYRVFCIDFKRTHGQGLVVDPYPGGGRG